MPSAAMCLNIGFRASGTGISLDVFTLRLTSGDHGSDAWFAALATEWGCEWITFDRDHARFPGLKWQLPAAP